MLGNRGDVKVRRNKRKVETKSSLGEIWLVLDGLWLSFRSHFWLQHFLRAQKLGVRPLTAEQAIRGATTKTARMANASSLREKHVKQLQKTQMCKFFMNHKRCGRGSNCSFAHDPSEIRERPNLNCTSMCKAFLTHGSCSNPKCAFAHDERELRATEGFFKSKMCRFASSGRCKNGRACRFAHAEEELNQKAEVPSAHLQNAQAQALVSLEPAISSYAPEVLLQSEILKAVQALKGQSLAPHFPPSSLAYSMGTGRDGRSDQSTRAGTATSPDRSGDSGEEANMPWPERRARDKTRHCTTMMMINVPQFLTQGALISLLEDLSPFVRGAFDFFYLPWDAAQEQNLGYAIINFFERSGAENFQEQWSDQVFPGGGKKPLRIVAAALQGRAANLQHFSGFRLAHHSDLRFRPVVRALVDEPLQPMMLPHELTRLGAYEM